MNITISCLGKEIGYWQADIVTDGQHQVVFVSDGDEYIDTFPVEYDNTITWTAGNDVYPGSFWIGYDLVNMEQVDTSFCGVPIPIPNEPQPPTIIVTPPPYPTPPPTDLVIPVSDGAYVVPNLVIFIAVIALVMRVIAKRL